MDKINAGSGVPTPSKVEDEYFKKENQRLIKALKTKNTLKSKKPDNISEDKVKTKLQKVGPLRIKIRKLICNTFGHVGNVQWGVKGSSKKTIHKCSYCCPNDQLFSDEKL